MKKFILLFWIQFFLVLPSWASIVVFAPHPDDEAISLGGWVADQVLQNKSVYGVMMTDGEAFARAVRSNRLSKRPFLASVDFRKLGKIRRVEGINAFLALGIPEEKQFFLAYPGNGLRRIFESSNADRLIKSPATRQRFGIACWQGNKRSVSFCRNSLIRDIDQILTKTRPEVVVIPALFDSNQDHIATAKIVLERLKALKQEPKIVMYLVHVGSRRNFPKPYGYKPDAGISDPIGLPKPQRYFPSKHALEKKSKALKSHRSQIRLKDGFLMSFMRREELFWIYENN